MKNIKKISVLLLPLIAILGVFFLRGSNAYAFVATSSDQIKNATFQFVNRGLIKVTIGTQSVDFVDSKPFDHGISFQAQNYDCPASIDLPDEPFALTNLGNYPTSLDPKYVKIQYNDGSGSGCKSASVAKAQPGINVAMKTWFEWTDATTIKRIDGSPIFTKAPNNDYYLDTSEDGKSCQDRIFVNGDNALYFQLDGDKYYDASNTDAKSYALSNCKIYDVNMQLVQGYSDINAAMTHPIVLGGVANKTQPAGSTAPSTATATDSGNSSDSCSSSALGWLLCPLTDAMGKFVDKIVDIITQQLEFKTSDFLPNDGSIHTAWAIIKNLVSIVVVLVLLFMVLSQAINYGPFDAYTIKKMLPRLVIAIIIMQVSWYLAKYLITLANDAGNGLKDIMLAPFNAADMSLTGLIEHYGGTGVASATSYGGMALLIVALLGFGEFFLPFVALAAFTAAMAVIVGIATLLFRNVLIVLLTITFPLALLLWALPGQTFQGYWKQWKDNFTKLLLLFPTMIALIYAGRIVAWTAGGVGGFLAYFLIFVAYFGPLFYLPKAFKWGGAWLNAANTAIANSAPFKKGNEVGKREILDWARRRSDQAAKDYDPDNPNRPSIETRNRQLFGRNIKTARIGGNVFQSMRARRFIPTRRSGAVMMQRGDEFSGKEDAIEETYAKRRRDKATAGKRDIMAGKQKSVDMLENALSTLTTKPGNRAAQRRGKAAIRDLIRSSSFLELAKVKFKDPTDGKTKFVWQTDLWRDTVAPDGELYGKVGASRPDWKPHRLPSGLPKYRGELAPDYKEKIAESTTEQMKREGKSDEEIKTAISTRITNAEQRAALLRSDEDIQYAAALQDVTGEMDARDLQSINPVFFERVGQMAEEGEQLLRQAEEAQALGNGEEAERLTVKAGELTKPAEIFRATAERLAKSGGQFQLSNIIGGQDTEELIDYALKYTGDGSGLTTIIQRANTPTETPVNTSTGAQRNNGAGGDNGVNRGGGGNSPGGGSGSGGGGNGPGGGGNSPGGGSGSGGGVSNPTPTVTLEPATMTVQQGAGTSFSVNQAIENLADAVNRNTIAQQKMAKGLQQDKNRFNATPNSISTEPSSTSEVKIDHSDGSQDQPTPSGEGI